MYVTDNYLSQLKKLHNDKSRPRGFGGKIKDIGDFFNFVNIWQPESILDYGCGKGVLLENFQKSFPNIVIYGYDPAVEKFSSMPASIVDCIFCNDVLEHIEPQFINDVLNHINKLSKKNIWLRIDTLPARKTLPDGRNAHLIIESNDWWTSQIKKSITGRIIYSNLNKKGKLDYAIVKETT